MFFTLCLDTFGFIFFSMFSTSINKLKGNEAL